MNTFIYYMCVYLKAHLRQRERQKIKIIKLQSRFTFDEQIPNKCPYFTIFFGLQRPYCGLKFGMGDFFLICLSW